MSENKQIFALDASFKIRLEMLSDWHVGTGTGIPGNIDALLARDHEGFPFVPAKTIVGIWRDAMERLTFGLDNGVENGVWSKWVELIFGAQPNQIDKGELANRISKNERTYSYSLLFLQPARISKGLRNKIENFSEADRIKYKQALTFIKPEIKIDEKSGTAEDDALRFAEMGRVGTVLEACSEVNFDRIVFDKNEAIAKKQKETILALLIASAKLVERIGGKRRRGSGKCKLEILGKQISNEIIKLLSEDASITPTIKEESSNHSFVAASSDNDWQKLEYTLTLKTPVSIVTATLGNVSETLDFIPGTYLLPHITKGKNLFKHIANGDIQVSPATIEIRVPKTNVNGDFESDEKGQIILEGKRGLPVPRVISAHKNGGGFDKKETVFNRFKDKTSEETPQLKPYREGYVSSLDQVGILPAYKKSQKTFLMHNTVQDDLQRPTSDVGGVYSRQAIAAGTSLRGEIRFKKSNDIEKEMKSFENTTTQVRLGTSKKDDYGLAELSFVKVEDVKSEAKPDGELIVYLESDVLLRNGSLRQTNSVDELKSFFEKKLSVTLTEKDSLIHVRRIESWHEGWGFPRPTLIAMQAGSCVRFEVVGFASLTQDERDKLTGNLKSLEDSGIGERRGEGYGRIRFNPKLIISEINGWKQNEAKPPGDSSGTTPKSIGKDVNEFAKQIELTAWRQELQRAVLLIADNADKRRDIFGLEFHNKESVPPLSQIGSLRSAIMRLKDNSKESKQLVTDWLTHLEQTTNRIKKWDGNGNPDKAKRKTLEIKKLISEESKVWLILCETKIEGMPVWQSPPLIVRTEKELQRELWAEAMRALFDACMRAHKREGGGN